MQKKSYFSLTITITILSFAITLYPNLAHGQQFIFPYSTTDSNQTQNESTTSSSFSDNSEKGSKSSSYSSNISAKSEDVNNYSSDSRANKVVILNFYDNDIGQFTNAKPILDEYGFKGTL
jgi:hypothetical protein